MTQTTKNTYDEIYVTHIIKHTYDEIYVNQIRITYDKIYVTLICSEEDVRRDLRTESYKVKMTEMSFLGNPTFHPPKEFTGKAEHFEEFSYKLRAYMNLLNPGYSHIFRSIEADPTQVIQDEDFHEVQQVRAEDCTVTQVVVTETKIAVLASVLQNVLTTPCAGDGSTLL